MQHLFLDSITLNNVGDLGFDPGSLSRATGEKVTVSEVSRVFRGTDNRQSVLGSWGPSAARQGRPKGDITLLDVLKAKFAYAISASSY